LTNFKSDAIVLHKENIMIFGGLKWFTAGVLTTLVFVYPVQTKEAFGWTIDTVTNVFTWSAEKTEVVINKIQEVSK